MFILEYVVLIYGVYDIIIDIIALKQSRVNTNEHQYLFEQARPSEI